MRKILLSLIIAVVSLFAFSPSVAFASVNVFGPCSTTAAGTAAVCQDVKNAPTGNPLIDIIKQVISVLSYIIGIAAVIMLIIAGFQMIINGGSAEELKSSRAMILYALIGIVVAVLAQLLVAFVLNHVQ